MEWITRLNLAMNNIEENLEGNISYDEAAKHAATSSYHFQRMFSYIADITLSEYIRRRKITKAAEDLQRGDKVVDIAMKYGYDSPTSFTRAFRNIHGVTPSKVKQDGVSVKAYPPISFSAKIKGDEEMNYRIEKKDSIRIVGYRTSLSKDMENNMKNIPEFWNKTTVGVRISVLSKLMSTDMPGVLGLSDFKEGRNDNYYYIAVVSSQPVPDGMYEKNVPASKYAVFSGEGPNPSAIQGLEKRIWSEWLPASNYDWTEAPDFELYLNEDQKNSKFEVWLPIK